MSSTDREADELVRHYAAGSRAKMRHDALIRDACRGAQGIIDFQPGGPATWTTTTSEIGAHYRPARKAPAADPRDAAPFTTMRVPVPRTTCGSPGQVTVRVPASVRRILQELRGAVEEAAAQRNLRAQSGASGRDLLLGTLMRHDRRGAGRLMFRDVVAALREIRVTRVTDADVERLAQWFHEGDGKLPYERVVREIWGGAAASPRAQTAAAGSAAAEGCAAAAAPSAPRRANGPKEMRTSSASLGKAGSIRRRQIQAEKVRLEKRIRALTLEEADRH